MCTFKQWSVHVQLLIPKCVVRFKYFWLIKKLQIARVFKVTRWEMKYIKAFCRKKKHLSCYLLVLLVSTGRVTVDLLLIYLRGKLSNFQTLCKLAGGLLRSFAFIHMPYLSWIFKGFPLPSQSVIYIVGNLLCFDWHLDRSKWYHIKISCD